MSTEQDKDKEISVPGKALRAIIHSIVNNRIYCNCLFLLNYLREWIWFGSYRKTDNFLLNFNLIEDYLINKKHSTFYCTTHIVPFKKMIKALNLPNDFIVLVDYGAGKGRVMILSAECGIHKIKGLEFSPTLYKLALGNIRDYVERTGNDQFELIHTDVVNYKVQKEDNVFYFFHPFDEYILSQCLDQIHLSLKTFPRKGWLIYHSHSKDYTKCITKGGIFKSLQPFIHWGSRFYIYEHTPCPQPPEVASIAPSRLKNQ